MKKEVRISVIIPCFNGEKYIASCLDSVLKSDFKSYEVIVVDDKSIDSSRQVLMRYGEESKIKTYFLESNRGPAVARNFGVLKSKGEVLVFLDIDTEIATDCLAEINKTFTINKELGAIQVKLLLGKTNKLDTAGHFLSRLGFPYEIGVGEIESEHNTIKEIFGCRSAGMAVKRDIFTKISGFDEDYLIYGEDTDLSWRIWLAGYSINYLPAARVRHFGKSSLDKRRVLYEGAKNNTGNMLKNAPLITIAWLLPLHFIGWLIVSIKLAFKGEWPLVGAINSGLMWNAGNINKVVIKRGLVAKYTATNNKVKEIIWGQVGFETIIKKGLEWFKSV